LYQEIEIVYTQVTSMPDGVPCLKRKGSPGCESVEDM